MSSPRIGVVRRSMLTNPLIIKAPLGQTQSRGLSHPGPDFTYGTSSNQQLGGVASALSSWHVESEISPEISAPHQPLAQDFVSLNRDAVKSGLVTAKELGQYRAVMGGTRTINPPPRQQQQASRCPAVPDITFGVPNPVSDPFKDIISHQYGRRWVEEQLGRNHTCSDKKQPRSGCVADTRTSLLRRSRPLPVAQAPLFTLPHFQQVSPALDTFRDEESRLRAFRAQQSDSDREDLNNLD